MSTAEVGPHERWRIGSIRTHYGESGVGVASDVGVFRLTMGIILGRMASSSV